MHVHHHAYVRQPITLYVYNSNLLIKQLVLIVIGVKVITRSGHVIVKSQKHTLLIQSFLIIKQIYYCLIHAHNYVKVNELLYCF